jgi:Domain of unknown function (DUF5667)
MTNDIERELDACLERIASGESIEEALGGYDAACADELRPLLELAWDLSSVSDPVIEEAATARLLAATAAPSKHPSPRPLAHVFTDFFNPVVLARAATIAIAVLCLGWGATVTSASAVPGDFFYPIKILTERARFHLTVGADGKAELRIVFSANRLKEAILKHEREGDLDESLLEEMLEEARLAVIEGDTLTGASKHLILTQATALTHYQRQTLSDLHANASEHVRNEVGPWMERCESRCQWMCGMMMEKSGMAMEWGPDEQQGMTPRTQESGMGMCPMW